MNFTHLTRRLAVALSTVGILLLATGCEKTTEQPIKLGINPWPGYEFLYLAEEMGFYQELGVDVKLIEYGSLSDVRHGYERGNLDAMASTLVEVLQVRSNSSRDPQIALIADFSNGGDIIIARNSIQSIADLKGKRVGADTTSLPIFLLARALKINGLSLDDVDVVSMEQSAMEQAYISNEIDAAVSYPPTSVRLLQRKDSHAIFSSQSIPGEIVDVLSVEHSILKERFEDIKKILLAWDKALKFSIKNPQKAYAIMANREGISSQEFANALNDLKIINLSEQSKYQPLLRPTLENVRDVLVSTGVLTKDTSTQCCINDALLHQLTQETTQRAPNN